MSEYETFQYTRHIFGAKSSPTCAKFVFQLTARVKSFPVASKAVFTSFCVDDFLQSVPCESDAVLLASQLVKMLAKGGFNLTKFVTDSLEVYKSLEDVTFAEPFSEMEVTAILGSQWDLKNYNMCVCRGVSNPLPENIPQRKILSVVSSVFDPSGFVSLFNIRGRLILKELWQLVRQAIRASTIPKLELQAAVIGLRLSMSIQSFLPFSVQNGFFWSHSSTALQCISSSDKRLPNFVADHVAEIIDGRNVEQWNFVPGQIIPADIGTRGTKMSELENTDWLRGTGSFLP